MKGHVHKYKKVVLGKNYTVYKCVLPGCDHYISVALALGKIAECWRCGSPFTITADIIRKGRVVAKPHCKPCTKSKKEKTEIIEKLLEML